MAGRLVGIDEVGRGPWAGPVVACAVRLQTDIDGLKDSKLLSPKKRRYLDEIIRKNAQIGLGWVSAADIDELGLSQAVATAMRRAYEELGPSSEDEIIIDGNINYLEDLSGSRAVVKADDKFTQVSAASIVAKVARDDYMVQMSVEYPGYGFEKHKGYGTAAHKSALQLRGVSPIHRRSFKPIRDLLEGRS